MNMDRKYLLGFVVFFLLVAAFGAASIVSLARGTSEQAERVARQVQKAVLAEKISALYDFQLALLPALALKASNGQLERIEQNHREFAALIAKLEVLSGNEDALSLIREIQKSERETFGFAESILQKRRFPKGPPIDEAALRDLLASRPFEIDKQLDQLTSRMDRRLVDVQQDARRVSAEHLQVAGALSVLALIFLGVIAGLLAHSARAKRREAVLQNRLLSNERRLSLARKEIVEVVAHDLKSPLATMEMSLRILQEDPRSQDGESKMGLEIAERSVLNMNQLIQQLLDNTKIESGNLVLEKEPCLLKKLAHLYVEPMRLVAREKSLDYRVSFPSGDESLLCDEMRLGQVLSNLIGNAVKYTPPGGRVQISAESLPSGWLFKIENAGAVIPSEVLPHIFDRYWQPRSSQKQGAGLGLAICKGLVEAHGGTIRVESAPEFGTRFSFFVPELSAELERANSAFAATARRERGLNPAGPSRKQNDGPSRSTPQN